MPDELEIITRIINEHRTIRDHLKLTGDAVTDQEALASLQESRAAFIPGRSEAVAETHLKLQQALSSLEEGLNNHFAFEETALPPLLGEKLTRALILEHRQINEAIQNTKNTVANTTLTGLERDVRLEQEARIHGIIDGVRTMVENHALREEAVLEMLKRALES
jgi:hypothetical protein